MTLGKGWSAGIAGVVVLLGAVSAGAAQSPPRASQEALGVAPADALRSRISAYVEPSNAARREVLKSQLKSAGLAFTTETFVGQEGAAGSNIVVELGSGEREILLTAHYDAAVMADGQLSHGLVDNAASVVALIDAARLLKGERLRHRIRLVFFDQEELGLIGARRWIEAHGVSKVAAVINSDVAGYGATMMYGENNGPQSAGLVRAVRELCAERAMDCVGYPEYPPSDDRAFIAAGAPTLSLGFQDAVGARQMWLAFNGGASALARGFEPRVFRIIHTPQDQIGEIDPDTVKAAAATYAALVRRLDGGLP